MAIALWLFVIMVSGSMPVITIKNTTLAPDSIYASIITQLSMLLISLILLLIFTKGKISQYGFTWNPHFPWIKVIVISLFFGALSAATGFLLNVTDSEVMNSFSFPELVIIVWILASFSEEVLHRGLIQSYLSPLKERGLFIRNHFLSLPVIVGAMLFGLMHLGILSIGADIKYVFIIVLFAILLGLIAGYQREKTGSLLPAYIVHACFNIGNYLFGTFLM